MNIYVIGPVTGKENENREEFERVRDELIASPHTHNVDIPHNHVEPWDEWRDAMCGSIRAMLWLARYSGVGDIPGFGIAMLDGWEHSRGARIEHDLAEALGIECRPWREWL